MSNFMIIAKTRKWGNSIGIVLPKKELALLNIGEDETVEIEIKRKENPLLELFYAKKEKKIGIAAVKELRKDWESKYA